MARVVIDTSVLVGFLDSADHWHSSATALMERLAANRDEAVYLDCVLGESVSVIARRMREQGRGEQIPDMVDELGFR